MQVAGFSGSRTVSVDAKGRTNLPMELRKQLPPECGGIVVVTIFADHSLALRPMPEWNRYISEVLGPLSEKDKIRNRFSMKVTAMAKISELDIQNRITLSPELMKYAGITKDVTFAGANNLIRLWNPESYIQVMDVPESEVEVHESLFFQNENPEG